MGDHVTQIAAGSSWQTTVILPVGLAGDEPGEELGEVTLRKMTGNEEALLADQRLRRNGGKLVSALIAGCARVDGRRLPTETVRRLTSADRNYLLLELRRLTFGDLMEARYPCPACGEWTAVLENLAELPVRGAGDADPGMEVEVELADGYRDTDGTVHRRLVFALPTGEDEEVAAGGRESNVSRQRDALITRCLRQVGDVDPRRVRATGTKILADLTMTDRRLVHRALDDAAPGPDLTRDVVCDHCLEEFRAALDMSRFFALE